MSRSDPPDSDAAPTEGDFLRRWSRRKAQARTPEPSRTSKAAEPEPLDPEAAHAASLGAPSSVRPLPEAADPGCLDSVSGSESAQQPVAEAERVARPAPTDADMPPLDSLNQDSDYSAFLSPKVSLQLRQAALRQLFRQPKFNVETCLDDFQDDFQNFAPLGDIVTTDMRYMTKVKARREAERQRLAAEAVPAVEPAARLTENSAGGSAERPAEDPAEGSNVGTVASLDSDTALPATEKPHPVAENAPVDTEPTDPASASVPDRVRDATGHSLGRRPSGPDSNAPDASDAAAREAVKAGIGPPDDEHDDEHKV